MYGVWLSINVVWHVNEVIICQAGLLLRWVTNRSRPYHLDIYYLL